MFFADLREDKQMSTSCSTVCFCCSHFKLYEHFPLRSKHLQSFILMFCFTLFVHKKHTD